MGLAEAAREWSKDPKTKVGAVLVSKDRRHISLGYNGFPRGVADDGRLEDRELKRKMVEHAERNCLHNCPFDPYPLDCTLYVTADPCTDCAKAIIQKGVKKVVYIPYPFVVYWHEDVEIAASMMKEAGLEVVAMHGENERPVPGDLRGTEGEQGSS